MPTTLTRVDEANDTEITLGTGKMLAIFFGLVVLCAVFFGMGFSMGRNSVRSAPELLPSPGTSAIQRPTVNSKSSQASPPAAQTPATAQPQTNSEPSPSPGASSGTAEAPPAQPSSPITSGYFVQVAAVSKQEDAEALVESLKGRQYSAFIANPSPDKLFHIQVGPFGDIKDAEAIRAKLVSDGYNPILKK